MTSIDLLNEKMAKIAEAGLELPCFAYVSTKSMTSIFGVYYPVRTEMSGFTYCSVYTHFGKIAIFAMDTLDDDDILLCSKSNLILDMFHKLCCNKVVYCEY